MMNLDKFLEFGVRFTGAMPLAFLLVTGVNLQRSGYAQKDLFLEIMGFLVVTSAIAVILRKKEAGE